MVVNVLCIKKVSLEEDIIGLHASTFNLTTTLKEGGGGAMAWFLTLNNTTWKRVLTYPPPNNHTCSIYTCTYYGNTSWLVILHEPSSSIKWSIVLLYELFVTMILNLSLSN